MFTQHSLFIFALFVNFWIWRIFSLSIPLGFLTLGSSILLYLLFREKSKHYLYIFLFLFTLLLFFQWQTTTRIPLTYLDNDEQRVQQERLGEYPPISVQLANKTIWVPIAHWFEGRKETVAFFRIQKNFFEAIDPNLYFFANHPRERVNIQEFEKFPYILFPVFLIGILSFTYKRMNPIWIPLVLPVILISFIGHKNALGPFSLFPFFTLTITQGINIGLAKIKQMSKKYVSH